MPRSSIARITTDARCMLFKGVDLTGLLGGHKRKMKVWGMESPSGCRGEVPQKLKLFCETTHNICIIKIQQTTVVTVTG